MTWMMIAKIYAVVGVSWSVTYVLTHHRVMTHRAMVAHGSHGLHPVWMRICGLMLAVVAAVIGLAVLWPFSAYAELSIPCEDGKHE